MLKINNHEIILKQVLRDIYKDKNLQGQLAFKGGTCLYLFYDLNRFSTDLDFNLVSKILDTKAVNNILEKYVQINNYSSKYNTWFWLGSYEKGLQKIKVEISKRDYPDKYINKNYFGITVSTMAPEYMFAHKLCAITNRKNLQNRDLYDAWFMFDKQWEPKEEIVKIRTGKTLVEYYQVLVKLINSLPSNYKVLNGLGEVLDLKQKDWVKVNLVQALLFQLEIRIKN